MTQKCILVQCLSYQITVFHKGDLYSPNHIHRAFCNTHGSKAKLKKLKENTNLLTTSEPPKVKVAIGKTHKNI